MKESDFLKLNSILCKAQQLYCDFSNKVDDIYNSDCNNHQDKYSDNYEKLSLSVLDK